jgi:hypothetical protein
MGKEKNHQNGIISYMRVWPPAIAALSLTMVAFAAGCAAGRPDHFAGLLQPQTGTCDPPGLAELILHDTHVLFTPHEGIISLTGVLAADGSIRASVTASGMDHTPYRQTFVGNLAGDRVIGTYITPRCRYLVNLAAPR